MFPETKPSGILGKYVHIVSGHHNKRANFCYPKEWVSRVVLNPHVVLSLSIENKLFLLFSEIQFLICIQAINTQSACSKIVATSSKC